MKLFAFCLSLIVLSACATKRAYNCNQYCSREGMICSGMNNASGSAVAMTPSGETINARSYSEGYACRIPATSEEQAAAGTYLAEAKRIQEHNEAASTRNMWYWIGGILAVVGASFLLPNPN